MRGFQKYSPFFKPPHVAPQIGRRSSPQLGFRRTLRRAFPAKPSCSGVNHHHHKVDPVVLYTVVYPFYRIHHCLTVSHSFFFLRRGIRRTSPWFSLFQAISGHGHGPPRLGPGAAAPGPHPRRHPEGPTLRGPCSPIPNPAAPRPGQQPPLLHHHRLATAPGTAPPPASCPAERPSAGRAPPGQGLPFPVGCCVLQISRQVFCTYRRAKVEDDDIYDFAI